MHTHVEIEAAAQNAVSQKSVFPRLLNRNVQALHGERVLLPDIDVSVLGADGIGIGCARKGPTAAEVRAACGPEVVLWGLGCAAKTLVSGTPGDACVEVAKLVEAAGGPERLVFAFGEPLPAGTKHENLLAALETARSMRP